MSKWWAYFFSYHY